MKKWLPLFITGVMVAWFVSTLSPPKDKTFAFSEFGRLPVIFNGRAQPIDSLARNSLLQIREKQKANLEPWKDATDHPKMISATEWLATVMMDPATADQWPVFRVDNQELISLLKLPGKDASQHHDGKYYSYAEIQPGLHALGTETDRIETDKKDASQRNAYERAAMKVRERLWLYFQLKNTIEPEDVDLKSEVMKLQSLYPAGAQSVAAFGTAISDFIKLGQEKAKGPAGDAATALAAAQTAAANFMDIVKTTQDGKAYTRDILETVLGEVEHLTSVINMAAPLVIPPRQAGLPHDAWKSMGFMLLAGLQNGQTDPSVQDYAAMVSSFQAGDAPEFNRQLAAYRASLAPNYPRELKKARWEVFFNQMQPFYNAMVFYVLAFALGCVFWFDLSEWSRLSAVWLVAAALVIHTTGLVFRIWLQGYAPVTNLYSSAIFIGWVAVIVGLVLEGFFRNSIGVVAASGIGFITAIIAHHLALGGDTMEMMRAVLDNNFWLTTHVLSVTTGYASTFLAGFLAFIYIIRGVFTTTLDSVTGKNLTRMIYGIVCFATLFSFVGTILGGIWADQSWGRFWGWDPKENGALIIVLWNALILHLRWGGMVRERGLATCAIIGNIVTSWSWFGVNMLNIGLHSYGFMEKAFWWLIAFVLSQLCLVALGCLPLKMWRSFRDQPIPNSSKPGETRAGVPATA